MTMWVVCICSGGEEKKSHYMTELENGNFLMTPRVFAFKRNPFSSCCFPFVTTDSWGASSDLERVLFSLLLASVTTSR